MMAASVSNGLVPPDDTAKAVSGQQTSSMNLIELFQEGEAHIGRKRQGATHAGWVGCVAGKPARPERAAACLCCSITSANTTLVHLVPWSVQD